MQKNTNILSKLIFSQDRASNMQAINFCINTSSLSPNPCNLLFYPFGIRVKGEVVKKIGRLAATGRLYSTHLISSNIDEINNNLKQAPYGFYSLEDGCEQIKYNFIGVSGVYKITNKRDPSRFYIGSSNNLARRIDEYNKLTKGLREPHSSSELIISQTPAKEWGLEFIYITTPQLSLVYEQYAIINLKPTINSYSKVVPRINPLWGNNLDSAIYEIENLLSSFPEGSHGYNRFNIFLKTYKIANNLIYGVEDADSKYYCSLIFVYENNSSNKDPIVYSSINKALKGLQISHSTLLDYINNKYIFRSNQILSFEPLAEYSFSEYSEKPEGDNQLRKHIIVYNQQGEAVFEFKSGREMARFFQIEGRVARAAIAKGEYQEFLLISKGVSYRKTINVSDSNTHELIIEFDSMTKAMKYAKVNFYTLKNLIDNGNSYKGKIYSYKDKI